MRLGQLLALHAGGPGSGPRPGQVKSATALSALHDRASKMPGRLKDFPSESAVSAFSKALEKLHSGVASHVAKFGGPSFSEGTIKESRQLLNEANRTKDWRMGSFKRDVALSNLHGLIDRLYS